MPPITLLTADDHPLLREGIASAIEGQPDMRLVAEATNGREALELYRLHRPDVTLLDLRMPDMSGIEVLIGVREESPSARVIVLTTYGGDALALRAIKAGAAGYLLKNMLRNDLVETIRKVHAGQRCIPPEIGAALAEHVTSESLSEREIAVLTLVAGGNANKRIAARLGITEDTVKAHLKSIFSKLNASDRAHAVSIGLQRGIIDI